MIESYFDTYYSILFLCDIFYTQYSWGATDQQENPSKRDRTGMRTHPDSPEREERDHGEARHYIGAYE